jgi:beta-aspartyl-dipeptidase (metallo-type)
VYTPDAAGLQSLLLVGEQIAKVGTISSKKLAALEMEVEIIDAAGCFVVPGFIDPHAHIIGAGGEEGFASRMPEILMSQLVCAGITTVIGLLGTDTTTRNLSCLHAKASQLYAEGLTSYIYTGGFELPATTLTGTVIDDLVMIDKIIGTGEIAISDPRWLDPKLYDLAHVVFQTALGGKMGGKAGVTHFHSGPSETKLSLLHQLLDEYEIPPSSIYATHINRSEALIEDGIALAKRGAYVDMDTVEEDLGERMQYYLEHGGPAKQITVSSDAHTPKGSSRKLYEQFVECVNHYEMPLAQVLPFFTSNVATVLKLPKKGHLQSGNDADVLVLRRNTLEIVHLFARGRQLIKDGQLIQLSKQEEEVEAGKE